MALYVREKNYHQRFEEKKILTQTKSPISRHKSQMVGSLSS